MSQLVIDNTSKPSTQNNTETRDPTEMRRPRFELGSIAIVEASGNCPTSF